MARQGNEAVRSSRQAPAFLVNNPARFGWRHVKGVAFIRALVAVWLVILGSIFCATGRWWGALLFVAAAFVGWLAYQMPRWKPSTPGEDGDGAPR